MLVNLLAAHAVRFKLSWNRAGIILIHAGIIVMMAGELITHLYAVEGRMTIMTGQASNKVYNPRFKCELAFMRAASDPQLDEVISVPATLLMHKGAVVDHKDVPVKIEVVQYMVNSSLPGETQWQKSRDQGNRGGGE